MVCRMGECGEYCCGMSSLRRLLETRAVDIRMIDLVRVGGVTTWLKAAALAEAFIISSCTQERP